jgi:hypothetical protein
MTLKPAAEPVFGSALTLHGTAPYRIAWDITACGKDFERLE